MSTFSVFCVLLLAGFVKNGECDATTEANLLALETSGKLIAPTNLAQKLASELQAIRAAYPAVSSITNNPPWIAGELLPQVSDEQLEQIRSQYGEVTSTPLFGDYKVLKFTTQYNPKVLVKELTSKKLVNSAEPNNVIGGGSSIHYDDLTDTYTFSKGWGDCPSGCINKHTWEFRVYQPLRVELLKESGAPLSEVIEEVF